MKTSLARILVACHLALAAIFAPCAQAAPTHTVLYSFQLGAPSAGTYPDAALVLGSDGNFYGTTRAGGANGYGTVFRMTSAGVLTTLVDFTKNGATNRGAQPMAALVQGSDGNFYGTTFLGGIPGVTSPDGAGTIFRMTPAGVLTTLVEFTDNGATNQGAWPYGALVQGSDGNFYGTTYLGSPNFRGTVFKMTPAGVLTTLAAFTGSGSYNVGANPQAGLVQGADGNFYGTTVNGGSLDVFDTDGMGTVFRITPAGALTTLVMFTGNGGANKGATPVAGLVQGSDGNFYGTTIGGGRNGQLGIGTVFRMTPAGVMTTLVDFNSTGATNTGWNPQAALMRASDGTFYGTTANGAVNGPGTIFQMTPGGVLATLVQFTDNGATNKGASPVAALVRGSDGSFYGTTSAGGTGGGGTVYRLTPDGAPAIYSITTSASPLAFGSTNGAFSKTAGSSVTVVATPNAGYRFLNWTEGANQVSSSASYTFTVSADRELVANFVQSATNANLSSLKPSGGVLAPEFASGTTSYTAKVAHTGLTIKVTPTAAEAGATVKVNGTTVTSGTASSPIALSVGANPPITTTVTAPDGTTTKTYTLTVTRASSDISRDSNGDNNADLLFQNTAGQIAVWYMNGSGGILSAAIPYTGGLGDWKIVGVGDMNSDGNTDILFQNTDGQIAVWHMNGSGAILSAAILYPGALGDWKIVGVGDMNNDGNADLLFQNTAGQIALWYLSGSGAIISASIPYTGGIGDWRIVGVGDMNNDGNTDILFQNTAGQIAVWYMNGSGAIASAVVLYGGGLGDWKIMGVADMNNDGNADILLQNTAGQIYAWYMNGSGGISSAASIYGGGLGDWRVH